MMMGTIVSLWRYDAAVNHALQSVNPRRFAILHYASYAAVLPDFQGGPAIPLIPAQTIDLETDVMRQLS